MDWLQTLLDSSDVPVVTAFILGLLTAISPCPLATNTAAIGYISKDIESRHRIFLRGLLYALGRIVAYSLLGVVLIASIREGASTFRIEKYVSEIGESVLPWALIAIGLFMLVAPWLNLPKFGINTECGSRAKGSWGALLLGILFAMTFCPSSGVFYFGMLIPMSASATGGYFLPVVFAIATGLPVVIVAWLLAYSIQSLGKFYNRMKAVQKWLSIVVAIVFILAGIYYLTMIYR